MATWIDFKELRSKLKIADVLAQHNVSLKIKGERGTCFCPLPGHARRSDGKRHSPSFSVHLRRGSFQCFSCGAKGNVLELAVLLDGKNPNDPSQLRQSALKIAESFGMISCHQPEGAPKKPAPQGESRATERATDAP